MPNPTYFPDEPISAIATALAPAALGIIRCSGKGCIQLVAAKFSRPAALLDAPGNSLVYGWIVDGGEKIDEVMLGIYRAPRSFTGEDLVEITCHGGPGVVMAIQSLLLNSGFRQAERGEFTFRAFINGKTDLTRAEAVQEIIGSRTAESRSRAAGRLAGTLFQEIDSVKRLVTDTLASIEVGIEYPEDEETIADSFDGAGLREAERRLSQLAASWKSEKLYQDGARLVLCGRTNAGKSSLFNAILKEERAIVSDVEGTTRDWLESWADMAGIPVRLFDTAGLRRTEDAVEAHGVSLTRSLSEDADVILYLADAARGLSADDREFLAGCPVPAVFVWSKCDLRSDVPALRPEEAAAIPALSAEVRVAVKTGAGISELCGAVVRVLTEGAATERPQAGIGSARQKSAVEEALATVRHAMEAAAEGIALDAVVQDLEDALGALGEITGDVSPDDVLGSIFSRFCVGK
ncbi:MAG: tRNA uridine-5-carboxymethylaminomethyl(34) synthesis GTPase MnmE [Treponemataceae bacterium]|nr:tRNA uridine-5-carboxymethylaminomethyl(34) synthesis GTPase MnmE [Treponemataceae bacterium]